MIHKPEIGGYVDIGVRSLRVLHALIEAEIAGQEVDEEELAGSFDLRPGMGSFLKGLVEEILDEEKHLYVKGEGFSHKGIIRGLGGISRFYPELRDILRTSEVIFEIASYPEVAIANEVKEILAEAEWFLKGVLSGHYRKDADDAKPPIFSSKPGKEDSIILSGRDLSLSNSGNLWTLMLLMKWAGNVADMEGPNVFKQKARQFLDNLVNRALFERRDVLHAFADFVFSKVEAAQEEGKKVKIVAMLPESEFLIEWLRVKAEVSHLDVDVDGLLLTVDMCDQIMAPKKIAPGEEVFWWVSLEPELKKGPFEFFKSYLIQQGIVSDEIDHLIVVDTLNFGFKNDLLSRALRLLGITHDYLLMYEGVWSQGSVKGLGSSPDHFELIKTDHRIPVIGIRHMLKAFSFLANVGFESSMQSPTKFLPGPSVDLLDTRRPYSHGLVRDSMQSLAKRLWYDPDLYSLPIPPSELARVRNNPKIKRAFVVYEMTRGAGRWGCEKVYANSEYYRDRSFIDSDLGLLWSSIEEIVPLLPKKFTLVITNDERFTQGYYAVVNAGQSISDKYPPETVFADWAFWHQHKAYRLSVFHRLIDVAEKRGPFIDSRVVDGERSSVEAPKLLDIKTILKKVDSAV